MFWQSNISSNTLSVNLLENGVFTFVTGCSSAGKNTKLLFFRVLAVFTSQKNKIREFELSITKNVHNFLR